MLRFIIFTLFVFPHLLNASPIGNMRKELIEKQKELFLVDKKELFEKFEELKILSSRFVKEVPEEVKEEDMKDTLFIFEVEDKLALIDPEIKTERHCKQTENAIRTFTDPLLLSKKDNDSTRFSIEVLNLFCK